MMESGSIRLRLLPSPVTHTTRTRKINMDVKFQVGSSSPQLTSKVHFPTPVQSDTKLTQGLLSNPRSHGPARRALCFQGNRPRRHLGHAPRNLRRVPPGARGRGRASAPPAPRRPHASPTPAPPPPPPCPRPRLLSVGPGRSRLSAPLPAQAQSRAPSAAPSAVRPLRLSVAASAGRLLSPLAASRRVPYSAKSAPERRQ